VDFKNEYTLSRLLAEESNLTLPVLEVSTAIELGEIAKFIGIVRKLPIAIEVLIGNWVVYHINLPGSTMENNWWITRKSRVVLLKRHSTLYERIWAKENGVDWFLLNNLSEQLYALHGGGIPIFTKEVGFAGVLLISGLPHIEDHLLGVEVLTEYLARKAELH
jgi:uncharacterized protein (UPF0303 family)